MTAKGPKVHSQLTLSLADAPMKERLSNFSSDADDANSTTGASSLEDSSEKTSKSQEVPPTSGTDSPTSPNGPAKKTLFGKIRKVPQNGVSNSLDVFHFEGDGLQFRGKLIGIKDVDGARGDEMCQLAMQELKNGLKHTKEHKTKIGICISLSGLKIKDEKGTSIMHQHPIPKISYIWRDPTDNRAFGYCYGTPDSGHRFFAIKAEKSADPLVAAIHRLFQVAFRMKQHEIEIAKKGQDGTSVDSGDNTKKDNNAEERSPNKVDEANLLDLETELEVLSHAFSKGIEQTSAAAAAGQNGWADFNTDSSSTSSSSDPFGGRGSTPHSIRTITPDPFDTAVSNAAFQTPSHSASSLSSPFIVPAQSSPQPFGWATANPVSITPNDPFSTQPLAMNAFSAPLNNNVFDIAGSGSTPSSFSSGGIFGSVGNTTSNNSNPFTGPANGFGMQEQFISVFDTPFAQPPSAPAPAPPIKKTSVPSNDGFELFSDLPTIGGPRAEKMSKKSFPMPIPPKLGELRGDVPSVIIPSPSTVDPFSVTLTGSSPPFAPPNSLANSVDLMGSAPLVPTRNLPVTPSVAPPQVPPRVSPQNSVNFPSLVPPPAPRRNGVTAVNHSNSGLFDGAHQANGSTVFGGHPQLHASQSVPVFGVQSSNMFMSSMTPPVFAAATQTAQIPILNGGVFQQKSTMVNDPFGDQFFK